MSTLLGLVIGMISFFLLLVEPLLGCPGLMLGALIFIAGNRIARQKKEELRHLEMLAAVRSQERVDEKPRRKKRRS